MDNKQTPVMPTATRRLPLEFDEDGNPMFRSVCSPESFKARGLAVTPRKHVIPVIFVPGIMGSNLRATKAVDKDQGGVWIPPNGAIGGLGEWLYRLFQSNAQRQQKMTPSHCEVSPEGARGALDIPDKHYTLTKNEAKRRGWGEVHWDSYGKVLLELERVLNDQFVECGTQNAHPMPEWQAAQVAERIKKWNPVKGVGESATAPLTGDEFERLDDYYYPVWACGYNWLDSNEQAAKRLMGRIQEALDWYSRPECQYFIPEGRVIIITHSMGGLVTRRAAQQMPDKIIGVVHGVQPVGGAAVVYRRFRAGTESGGFWDIEGNIVAEIMGWDAKAITCVMANAPGPMELLPTKDYPAGWLRFERKEGETTTAAMPALPVSDPYTEIYSKRVQDVWWGMVDETLIDPAGLAGKDHNMSPYEWHDVQLTKAKNFHDKVGLYFHPKTYAHYGSDHKQRSFGAVRWVTTDHVPGKLAEGLAAWPSGEWSSSGKATLKDGQQEVRWRLVGKTEPKDDLHEDAGDATVPRESGALIEKGGSAMQAAFRLTGVEHAASYKHPEVIACVTYSVGKLIQLATPVKDLPSCKGGAACPPPTSDNTSAESPSALPQPVEP